MLLPSGNTVNSHTPIYSGSNFTWGEVTNNCQRHIQDLIIDGKLILSANKIEQNIITTARNLDDIRGQLGNYPLWVNSWYRPSYINVRVGGSKWSRHQYGDAVDIRSDYLPAGQIYRKLRDVHVGGLGRYYSFVHVDFRADIARWSG